MGWAYEPTSNVPFVSQLYLQACCVMPAIFGLLQSFYYVIAMQVLHLEMRSYIVYMSWWKISVHCLFSTWQVVGSMWLLSAIGRLFSFFTLTYIGMLASLVYLLKAICDIFNWDPPFSLMYSKFHATFFLGISLEPFGFPFNAFFYCLVFGGWF